jgi:predicted dehydrogenase
MWPVELYITRDGKTEVVRIEPADLPQHILMPYALQLNHFCQCIRESRPPQFPTAVDAERDSRGNMRAIEALHKAAREGSVISV